MKRKITSKIRDAISYLERLAGRFDPEKKDYTGKYLTSFYLEDDFGIPHCHVTHKYLGEQTPEDLERITRLLNTYMIDHARELSEPRAWVFDQFEMFGPNQDTPVLAAEPASNMLLDLRKQLGEFREDDFPSYRPHITLPDASNVKALVAKPVKIALVSNDTILKEWPIGKGN